MEPDPNEESPLGRFVFAAQWLVPLVVPVLLFGARAWLGAPSGWLTGAGTFLLAPPSFLVLGLPVVVVASDPGPMRSRAVPAAYARASVTLWVALAVLVLAVSDPAVPGSALLTVWSGGAVPAGAVSGLATAAAVVAVAAWASALGFAVSGFLAGRRARPE